MADWINNVCKAVTDNWVILGLIIIAILAIVDNLADVYIKIKNSKGDKNNGD